MTIKKNLLLSVVFSLVLAACASPAPSVIVPLPPPKPQVPADLMVPLPAPLYFQMKSDALLIDLQQALDNWQKKQIQATP